MVECEAGKDVWGETSGANIETITPLRRSTRPGRGNKMSQTLSSRVAALEEAPQEDSRASQEVSAGAVRTDKGARSASRGTLT